MRKIFTMCTMTLTNNQLQHRLTFRTGTGGGLLWTRQWTFRFHKMRVISWLAEELLVSQERSAAWSSVYHGLIQVFIFVTYLTGALYVHHLWFYKHQHDNRVRSKLFVACQRWWFQWRFWFVESSWNVMAHGDAWEGKWRGNWRIEWVVSTLHTTSEHGASSITTADAHTSAVNSRLNWRPRRFKWTRPFRRKTKSGLCACAIIFQTQSTFSSEYTRTVSLETVHTTFNGIVRWWLFPEFGAELPLDYCTPTIILNNHLPLSLSLYIYIYIYNFKMRT